MDDCDLSGKVALLTGGGRGIGAGIAMAMGRAGARTVLVARSRSELENQVDLIREAGGEAEGIPWDITADNAGKLVGEVIRRTGGLDVLVHAAGNQVRKETAAFGLGDLDKVLDLHLRAALVLCQATVAHMRQAGRPGSLLLVGSMTSWRLGHPGTVGYNMAKSGILGLMRTLAVEFGQYQIRCNALLPGFIRSAMAAEVEASPERRALTERIPAGRYGTPEDLGGIAVLLASEKASYITGAAIPVDGGWSVA